MFRQKKQSKIKKLLVTFLLFVIVFSSTGPALLYPRPARAQAVVTDLVGTATDVGQFISNWITSNYQGILKQLGATLFKNVIGGFLNQIATDAAMSIANGGKGQGSMFVGNASYWANLADSVTGDLLNEFAQGAFGIDLCTVGWDPKLQLSMMFQIEDPCAQFDQTDDRKPAGSPPAQCKPKCSISAMSKNLSKLKNLSLKNRISFNVGITQGGSSFKNNAEAISSSIRNDTVLYGAPLRADLLAAQDSVRNIGEEYYSKLGTDILGWSEIGSGIPESDKPLSTSEQTAVDARKEQYDAEKADFIGKVNLLIASLEIVTTRVKVIQNVCAGQSEGGVCWTVNYGYENNGSVKNAIDNYANQILNYANSVKADLNDVLSKLQNDELKTTSDYVSLADSAKALKSNDYNAFLETQAKVADQAAKKKERKEFSQTLQGRLNDVTSTISDQTKTPSVMIKQQVDTAQGQSGSSVKTYTQSILADAVGVFANTLMNQLMKKLMTGLSSALNPQATKRDYSDVYNSTPASSPTVYGGGCNSDTDCDPGYICKKSGAPTGYCDKAAQCSQSGENCYIPTDCCRGLVCSQGKCFTPAPPEGQNMTQAPDVLSDLPGGAEQSKEYLSFNLDLKKVEPTSYDLLTEFSICSVSAQINRIPVNCVIDQGFAQAIQDQSSFGAMSMQDAIGKDYLHKNWKVGQ